MKTCKFLFLSILAVVWLSACNEKEEPIMPEVEVGVETEKEDSILLGDKAVKVNTNFTEDEILKALQAHIWYNNPVFPYIYDIGVTKEIDWGIYNFNFPEPEQYKFLENGKMNILGGRYSTLIYSYKVSGKIIRIDYTKENGDRGFEEVEVVSLTNNMIIFDRKYNDFYISGDYFMELNNWFNPETAKLRYEAVSKLEFLAQFLFC